MKNRRALFFAVLIVCGISQTAAATTDPCNILLQASLENIDELARLYVEIEASSGSRDAIAQTALREEAEQRYSELKSQFNDSDEFDRQFQNLVEKRRSKVTKDLSSQTEGRRGRKAEEIGYVPRNYSTVAGNLNLTSAVSQAVYLSNSNRYVTLESTGRISVHDANTHSTLAVLPNSDKIKTRGIIGVSADQKHLVQMTISSGKIQKWKLTEPLVKQGRKFPAFEETSENTVFNDDLSVAVAPHHRHFYVRTLSGELEVLPAYVPHAQALSFETPTDLIYVHCYTTPNGPDRIGVARRSLVEDAYQNLELENPKIRSGVIEYSRINAITWSKDHRVLYLSVEIRANNKNYIYSGAWDTATGKLLFDIGGPPSHEHQNYFQNFQLDESDQRLYATAFGKPIHVFRNDTGELIQKIGKFANDRPMALVISPRGKSIVAFTSMGKTLILEESPDPSEAKP